MFTDFGWANRVLRHPATRLWIGWIILLLLFQQAAWMRLDVIGPDTGYGWTYEHSTDPPPRGIGLSHARWDSFHYLRLAQKGYHQTEDAAYYPLYPLLIRMVGLGIIQSLRPQASTDEALASGGLVISIVASLVAAWAMYALALNRLGSSDQALRVLFYLLTFPTALFMIQVYTESLYLALSLLALVALDRDRWWAAGILAGLAALTRPTGLLLLGPMAVYWWQFRRPACVMLIPLSGWLAWMLFLASQGLSITAAEHVYGRVLFDPHGVQTILNDLGYMLTHRMGAVQIATDLALTLLAGWSCWHTRHDWPGLALYGGAALLLPLATGQIVSMNRYALVVVPLYLVLARQGNLIDRLWTWFSVLLLALGLIGFVHGYWTG